MSRADMRNAERYCFRDFTRANHRRLIRLAKRTYVFRTFSHFRRNERFVIWRHDIDFSPQAAVKLAQGEADEGVRATYFLHLHSEFYNLLERAVSDCVRTILSLGHEIGLHFDTAYAGPRSADELLEGLAREKRLLEDVFERSCPVFSFHNPTAAVERYDALRYAGMINAAGAYFRERVGFCSDSNGYWRRRRLEDVLRAGPDERLQVLTHPEMWTPRPMAPRQRIHRCIDGRARTAARYYDRLLKANGRPNIDGD